MRNNVVSQRTREAFKAYDIRGRVPEELDAALAYRIGRAYAALFCPKTVAVSRDNRLSGSELSGALVAGLTDAGVHVVNIGQCGTELVYFATAQLGLDGGIMVTASHNPKDYNGMKLVRSGATPISGDSGLEDLCALVFSHEGALGDPLCAKGVERHLDILPAYTEKILSMINPAQIAPLKVVVNGGNGCAGPVLDALARSLPVTFIRINHEPDGTFPSGVPNPLLPENRAATAEAVLATGADLGIAWDGDFDRCFFFDEAGRFIEGYYMVGLLAQAMLARYPGAAILHDPRLTWNTVDLVRERGGRPIQCKTGHAFMKERMRLEDAAYGGEMSAHHYFKDFFYCDSGMLPWLKLLEIMSREKKPLSALVAQRQALYPVSGELNRTVRDRARTMQLLEARYCAGALSLDRTDGVSFQYENWRFNVRPSNTEPVLRITVETRGDLDLLRRQTAEILDFIDHETDREAEYEYA